MDRINESIKAIRGGYELQYRIIFGFLWSVLTMVCALVGQHLYIGFMLMLALLVAIEMMQIISKIEVNLITKIANPNLVAMYSFIPYFALILIRNMEDGLGMTIWLYCTIWATDIGAYVVGKKLGKIKIIPTISPGKTLEGSIAGLVLGATTSFIVFMIFSTKYSILSGQIEVLLLGLFVSALSQFGDGFESWIKRKGGVKDSGNIIPGHGGIADRMDSFTFAAPVVLLIIWISGGSIFG